MSDYENDWKEREMSEEEKKKEWKKRRNVKYLADDTTSKIEWKRKEAKKLKKKLEDTREELLLLRRRQGNMSYMTRMYDRGETAEDDDVLKRMEDEYEIETYEDYTEWARKTVKEEMEKKSSSERTFAYQAVLEKLERYLEEDGEICPGKGMTIAIARKEKRMVDEAMKQLEALGFQTEYEVHKKRREYFITKRYSDQYSIYPDE